MPTDEELLQQNPDARGLIEAGVPREEVLAGLRQAAEEAAANPTPPPLSRKSARACSSWPQAHSVLQRSQFGAWKWGHLGRG